MTRQYSGRCQYCLTENLTLTLSENSPRHAPFWILPDHSRGDPQARGRLCEGSGRVWRIVL